MTKEFCDIVLSHRPLVPPPPHFTDDAGGIVEFYGVVRGLEGETPIRGIEYEAHDEMARHQLIQLAGEACELFPILELSLHHRIGFVAVAEPSLFVRVSAPHRGPALAAVEWLIAQLKQRVPIWKHPVPRHAAATGSSKGTARQGSPRANLLAAAS